MSVVSAIGDIITKALPFVSAGLGLLSTVKSYQGAKAIEQQGQYNTEVYNDEAAAAWRAYQDRAAIQRDDQRRANATAVTQYAKSGVTMTGSAMDVLNDMVYRQKLDNTALYDTAAVDSKRLRTQAVQAEWQAHNQANAVRSQALTNFGSTLLGTADKLYYGNPWTSKTDDKVVASIEAAPKSKANYTRAQANAVPGASGWRPIQ